MDEMLKESLAGFDAVWQRVTGQSAPAVDGGGASAPCAGPPEPRPPEDVLAELIRRETCAGTWAGTLARAFPADGRAVLQRMAAGSRRRLRRLRAERFIATGSAGEEIGDCGPQPGKLAALRALYLQYGRLAEQYEAAAGRQTDPGAGDALAAFAAETRRSAQEARALLIECF